MSKCIVCTRSDGSVSILYPDPQWRQDGESEDAWLARVAAKDVPAGWLFRIVDVARLPQDRTFREAWTDDGAAVKVDMPKARAVHKEKLLALRDSWIAVVRQQIDRADDNDRPQDVAQLKARRRRLNRLEATLDADLAALTTPESLAEFVPADLL